MKSRYLDETRNKIELSGEINENFVINNGVTITFAEGSTFKGITIKAGTEFYNNSYIPQMFQLISSGTLKMIPAVMDRPGTPHPSAPSSGGSAPDDINKYNLSDSSDGEDDTESVEVTGCGSTMCTLL